MTARIAIAAAAFLVLAGGDLLAAPVLKPADQRATRIVVEKAARTLTLFKGDTALATYRVALGGNPVGPKERQGDSRTPEGDYTIDFKNTSGPIPTFAFPCSTHRSKCRNQKDH